MRLQTSIQAPQAPQRNEAAPFARAGRPVGRLPGRGCRCVGAGACRPPIPASLTNVCDPVCAVCSESIPPPGRARSRSVRSGLSRGQGPGLRPALKSVPPKGAPLVHVTLGGGSLAAPLAGSRAVWAAGTGLSCRRAARRALLGVTCGRRAEEWLSCGARGRAGSFCHSRRPRPATDSFFSVTARERARLSVHVVPVPESMGFSAV